MQVLVARKNGKPTFSQACRLKELLLKLQIKYRWKVEVWDAKHAEDVKYLLWKMDTYIVLAIIYGGSFRYEDMETSRYLPSYVTTQVTYEEVKILEEISFLQHCLWAVETNWEDELYEPDL